MSSALLALLLAGAAAAAEGAAPAASTAPSYGVLLLAHGGDARWNAQIEALRARADGAIPHELALGMADPDAIAAATRRLVARGALRVVAVPLFVHSRSEVMDQTRYVLGLAEKPSEVLREAARRMSRLPPGGGLAHHAAHPGPGHAHHQLFSLERAVPERPTALTAALDDDPVVSAVLLDRARALSREPARETVLLVAHGPVDPAAVADWERALAAHAARVKEGGAFRAAAGLMLRDDAAPEVRAAAVARLREAVAAGARDGRALVVPLLLARGGIERKIPRELHGLSYAWDGRTLMPDPRFDAWLKARAESGAALPDMRLPGLSWGTGTQLK